MVRVRYIPLTHTKVQSEKVEIVFFVSHFRKLKARKMLLHIVLFLLLDNALCRQFR